MIRRGRAPLVAMFDMCDESEDGELINKKGCEDDMDSVHCYSEWKSISFCASKRASCVESFEIDIYIY
jgi:hypothetical protein